MTACWCACRPRSRPWPSLPRSCAHRLRPAECGRGNRAGGSRSYRLRLREHLGPELRRQVAGSQQIDVNAEQRFQFFFQIAQVQQRGTGQRPTGRGRCHPGRCHAAPSRRRAGSRRESGLPLHALRFASCQAQQTVACASFLIETR